MCLKSPQLEGFDPRTHTEICILGRFLVVYPLHYQNISKNDLKSLIFTISGMARKCLEITFYRRQRVDVFNSRWLNVFGVPATRRVRSPDPYGNLHFGAKFPYSALTKPKYRQKCSKIMDFHILRFGSKMLQNRLLRCP